MQHNIATGASAQDVSCPPLPDENYILDAINTLFNPDDIIELRALISHGRKRTDAGYFDGAHHNDLAREAVRLNRIGAAVYVTLNTIDPQLGARYANRIEQQAQATTSDNNIIQRNWLLLDFDPVRPKDTSTTDAQLAASIECAKRCIAFLHVQGWPNPLIALSGNGIHLLYRLNLPNDDPTRDLIKSILYILAARFDNDIVKLDKSVFNASRIIKLYGTVANKGDHTPLAPHRLSRIMAKPAEGIVSLEQLQALIVLESQQTGLFQSAAGFNLANAVIANVPTSTFDLNNFLEKLDIGYVCDEYQGGERFKLNHCPFNPEHKSGEAAIFRAANGALGFKCQHNSCIDKHWRDVRALIDGENASDHPAVNNQLANDAVPDMSILRQGRNTPPPFPLQLLGEKWSICLTDAAEGAGAPVDYVAGTLLATASAMIGNARRIAVWEGWVEPCALWVANVGNPSSGKSHGADPILNPARLIENDMAAGFEQKQCEWETLNKAAVLARESWEKAVKDAVKIGATPPIMPASAIAPEPIKRPRLIGNDTSTEQLGILLFAHDKGLLFFRDELSGWLGAFDRYAGNGADRAFWTEAYGGRPYTIDRVKHPLPIKIPHLLVSVAGGIQPDKLHDLFKGEDDGLTARFLWLWPDPIPPYRPKRHADSAIILAALRRLSALSLENDPITGIRCPRVIPLAEDARVVFQNWREVHYIAAQNVGGLLASSYGKAHGHVARLAMTLEYLWWAMAPDAPEPKVISPEAVVAAIGLVDTYFKLMAERVFGDAAVPEEERLASTLARYIVRTKPVMINLRVIGRKAKLEGLKKPEKVKMAANALVDANWLFPPSAISAPGRPREDYRVNPNLWALLS